MRKSTPLTALGLVLGALTLVAPHLAYAADPDKSKAVDKKDADADDSDKDEKDSIADKITKATATAPITEKSKTTSHSVTVKGQKIDYKATAGTLTIRDEDGKPTASVFYVAYTAKPGAHRPVTFLYNGGPGSASLWLHMGSFGPVRVRTTSPEATGPAPYTYGPNDESLLDKTDLVFIDAIGTGYSRPLGDTKGETFWGVDQDADAFARAIKRYVTLNERWNSPKFLFGESYGTTRSANLVNVLQGQGMDFNGVILLSSILNYGVEQPGYDIGYIAYLPSFAATAWYHDKLKNKPTDLAAFVDEVRTFAAGPYSAALAKGHNLGDAERDAIAQKISDYTGLSVDYIIKCNLRIDLNRFQKELLRDRHETVGRFDSRFMGVDSDDAGESPDFDASDVGINSVFVSSLRAYLTADLGYKTDMDYRLGAYDQSDFKWDWKHNPAQGWQQQVPDVAVDLGAAMRQNPHLKLLSVNGYYDMATPFFATEYDIGHIPMNKATVSNISFKYYPSGHMIYLNPEALTSLVKDLDVFYDQAAPQ